jgi:hypothetical protein
VAALARIGPRDLRRHDLVVRDDGRRGAPVGGSRQRRGEVVQVVVFAVIDAGGGRTRWVVHGGRVRPRRAAVAHGFMGRRRCGGGARVGVVRLFWGVS